MPAPRLLDKRVVNQELALQKKNQIESGIALAKKVDAVREALGEEEKRLAEFREQSIARVQIEIDAKIRERDSILPEIARLKQERILAQAPLDLKTEWQKVREDALNTSAWEGRLTQQQIEVLAKEEDITVSLEKLEKEKEEIRSEHELAQINLKEAERERSEADSALQRAEDEAQRILQTAQQRNNHLKVREEDATNREINLSRREEDVQAHEIDLSNRETKLKVNQEMFLKAKRYIKNKRK